MYITQDVLNSPALFNLSIVMWLAVEAINVIIELLSLTVQSWELRHEREIAVQVETYIAEHNDCTYDELAVHCMPGKIHVGLESAVQNLVYFQKIVRYTDNGTVRLRLPTEEERLTGAMIAAKELCCIILRKGHETVITDGKDYYINPTGNPGMAVGGSGDVLAGILVSLLGQKVAPLQATACAAWLHGAAGDRCAEKLGQYGMLPSDMVAELPYLLK